MFLQINFNLKYCVLKFKTVRCMVNVTESRENNLLTNELRNINIARVCAAKSVNMGISMQGYGMQVYNICRSFNLTICLHCRANGCLH